MPAFLCIASYFKGAKFFKACKEAGNQVFLVTSTKWKDKPWPQEYIDEMFFMELDEEGSWNMKHLIEGVAYFMRNQKIDRIVALDDFDVEKAATLREMFRIGGMGQSIANYFRDKLAMRIRALEAHAAVPDFSDMFNDEHIRRFTDTVPAPWFIKPRSEASTMGIYQCENEKQVHAFLKSHSNSRHKYLIEAFIEGEVYHVDSFSSAGKIVFSQSSQYLSPPYEVTHSSGIFRSISVEYGSNDDTTLLKLNSSVLHAFGIKDGPSHTEFIKCRKTGRFYFLETASRLAGAFIPEMVEAASGVDLWKEWAVCETALCKGESYKIPKRKEEYAGIVTSLSKYPNPDYADFKAKKGEIFHTIEFIHHVGLIVKSTDRSRVEALIEEFTSLIQDRYHADGCLPEKRVY